MFGGWLKRRRLARLCNRFAAQLQQGNVPQALELYEAELLPPDWQIPAPVRAAYHFHRWLEHRDGKDSRALKALAESSSGGSPVAEAWTVLLALQRQLLLAEAVSKAAEVPAVAGGSDPDPQVAAVENLARHLAAFRRLLASAPENKRKAFAQLLLRDLPRPGALPEWGRPAAAHLLLWAAWTLSEYKRICGDQELLAALAPETRTRVLTAAGGIWGRQSLVAGDIRQAAAALDVLRSHGDPARLPGLALAWGMQALEQGQHKPAAQWFSEQGDARRLGAGGWAEVFVLAWGTAAIRLKAFSQARENLGRLTPDPNAADPNAVLVRAQAQYLVALSLLAGTREWAALSGSPEPEAVARDRDTAVRNRALWESVREQLLPLTALLIGASPALAWRGHLLMGMVAHVDRSLTPSSGQIEDFSKAIESVDSETARTRLRHIEGDLRAKAKATEAAVDLLQRQAWDRLREHKQTVLDSLGDAIPSAVRAAVCLALWHDDPGYEPLAELYRLPTQESDEALISDAIRQVETTQAIKALTAECVSTVDTGRALPDVAQVAHAGPDAQRLTALALAAISARRQDWQRMEDVLPEPGDETEAQDVLYLRFVRAWRGGDLPACSALVDEGVGASPLLARQALWRRALQVRMLLDSLHRQDEDAAGAALYEAFDGVTDAALPWALIGLTVRLLEQQRAQSALLLLEIVGRDIQTQAAESPQIGELAWTTDLLYVLVAAQLGQHTACQEAVERLVEQTPPDSTVFGNAAEHSRLMGWARLMRLQAAIALTVDAPDDLSARWGSLQRALTDRARELASESAVEPYALLINGLLAYLSADRLVDEETVAGLRLVQRVLPLSRRSAFLEGVIGQLNWRKQVIDDFWSAMREGDFADARRIYHEELAPAFGDRMPNSIRLGMVLADWSTNEASTQDLLERLEILQFEAPELGSDLMTKVRDYIDDGEKVRRLVGHLQQREFDDIIDFATQTNWAGLEPGSMPISCAVLLVYAYYKVRRVDEAARMGEVLSGDNKYGQWVTDYGSLLMGYLLFEQERFDDAAQAFERISASEILGHDTDRYWAASRFSQGLQLLKVDQRETAFDAFAQSLGKRGGHAENARLAPLFIHFGLASIERRNGNRARHSFLLLREALESMESAPEVAWHHFLASYGQDLCDALLAEDIEEFGGERFLKLLPEIASADDAIDADQRLAAEHSLYRMAICQELRREYRRARPDRQKRKPLAKFLTTQISLLESALERAQMQDPMVLLLKGMVALRITQGGSRADALDALEKAVRLGVHSSALSQLLERLRQEEVDRRETQGKALDIFDAYLATGSVPLELRQSLVRRDDLSELYRLNRHYSPTDVLGGECPTTVAALAKRIDDLRSMLADDGLADEDDFRGQAERLEVLMASLQAGEQELMEIENKVLGALAAKLRKGSFA